MAISSLKARLFVEQNLVAEAKLSSQGNSNLMNIMFLAVLEVTD